MTAVWHCRCPAVTQDDDGRCWPCRIIAYVVRFEDFDSTSGPVLAAVVSCPVHRNTLVLYDDLDLLA